MRSKDFCSLDFSPEITEGETVSRFESSPAGSMPLTKSSTHGWMMTANTCAPPRPKDRRHLETEVKGIMNIESEAYQKSDAPWQTTSSSAFRGFDNATMRKAKLPTTMDPAQPNQTFPDEEEEFQRQMRYQSSHKTQFLDWKPPRHVMIRRRTNDPSENDHPMVGRHDDPGRLELQAAMGPPVSTAAAAYANPGRGSYQPLRCAPRRLRTARARARTEPVGVTRVSHACPRRKIDPFRHTSTAWNENWKMSEQHSESRSSFHTHPQGYVRVKSAKHLHSDLVLA